MTEHQFKELMQRYTHRLTGPAEEDMLFRWIDNWGNKDISVWSEGERDIFMRLLDERIFRETGLNVSPATTPVHARRKWYRMAVAASIAALVSFSAYWWLADRKGQPMVVKAGKHIPIVPGRETAILTLADGTSIVLDSIRNGRFAQQGGAEIVKLEGNQISYNQQGIKADEIFMNTMSTPKGGKYQIVLPDGSRAWLNSASSITYPSAFTGSNRRVKTTGEVYFEIAQNKEKPFIVDVDSKTSVQVLGTSFNLNAYSDEGSINTTLLEGSVRIMTNSSVILRPRQQARVIRGTENDIVVEANADIDQALAWKDGFLDFNHSDIQTAMRKIARWYNVEVAFEGAISQERLVGKLPMNANIDKVLSILEKIGFHCKIEGQKITVKN